MVGDPSAITATARSQEKHMLLILLTGSAAGKPARSRRESPKPRNILAVHSVTGLGPFRSEDFTGEHLLLAHVGAASRPFRSGERTCVCALEVEGPVKRY